MIFKMFKDVETVDSVLQSLTLNFEMYTNY